MRCICVGGGDFARKKFNSKEDDLVIAADSGYSYIKELSHVDEVIGDFDSLGFVPKGEKVTKLNCKKDNTDMMEATDLGYSKGAREFVLYGALGKRLDHTIANLQNAKSLVEKGCSVKAIDLKQTVYFTNKPLSIQNVLGKTISIYSFDEATLSLEGFEYPLNNYTLTNSYPLGTSNVAVKDEVTINVSKGVIMIIVNDNI